MKIPYKREDGFIWAEQETQEVQEEDIQAVVTPLAADTREVEEVPLAVEEVPLAVEEAHPAVEEVHPAAGEAHLAAGALEVPQAADPVEVYSVIAREAVVPIAAEDFLAGDHLGKIKQSS